MLFFARKIEVNSYVFTPGSLLFRGNLSIANLLTVVNLSGYNIYIIFTIRVALFLRRDKKNTDNEERGCSMI